MIDKRLRKTFIYYLMLGLLLMLSTANAKQMRFGYYTLEIPREYMISDSWISYIIDSIPGLDKPIAEFLVEIPGEVIAANILGYVPYSEKLENSIFLRVELLSAEDLAGYSDPQNAVYSDSWYGKGVYKNGTIEYDKESGYYLLHSTVGSSMIAARIPPNPPKPPPDNPHDYYIGICRNRHSPLTQSGMVFGCKTHFLVDGVLFDYNITGRDNFALVDDIERFLTELFESWKQETK